MIDELTECRRRVAELELTIQLLHAQNPERQTWKAVGQRWERKVAELIGGAGTPNTGRYDVFTRNRLRLEVKYSTLNTPVKNAPTRRWAWIHIKGADGGKSYDNLILVGLADERFRGSYRESDPEWSEVVLFDVPFDELEAVTNDGIQINCTTNPRKPGKPGARKLLFDRYQITSSELRKKYQ